VYHDEKGMKIQYAASDAQFWGGGGTSGITTPSRKKLHRHGRKRKTRMGGAYEKKREEKDLVP